MKELVYIAVFAVFGLLWCNTNVDEPTARKQARAMGFANVKTFRDYAWFACGTGDWSGTPFTGTNANGQPVDGVVCCGLLFKACTVRLR